MLRDGAEGISSWKSVRKSNANPKETLKFRLNKNKILAHILVILTLYELYIISTVFLLCPLCIVNYHVKSLSNNLSNENIDCCFQRNDSSIIVH